MENKKNCEKTFFLLDPLDVCNPSRWVYVLSMSIVFPGVKNDMFNCQRYVLYIEVTR